MQQAEAVAGYSASCAARELRDWRTVAAGTSIALQSELAALRQQLASRAAHEEQLRQALPDVDVALREQVAKAYQDGLEKGWVDGIRSFLVTLPNASRWGT